MAVVDLLEAPRSLGAWRAERLKKLKQRPEYTGLPLGLRNLVDYMVKRYESPDEGIIVKQTRLALEQHVCERTLSTALGKLVKAGIFTVERRARRGAMCGAGRTTNRYRVNEALLLGEEASVACVGEILPVVLPVVLRSGSSPTENTRKLPLQGSTMNAAVERTSPPYGLEPQAASEDEPAKPESPAMNTTTASENKSLDELQADFVVRWIETFSEVPTLERIPDTVAGCTAQLLRRAPVCW
jgi:hypothetical protein